MTFPHVTIVIPSRNRPEFARRAVHRALRQVGVDIEVLLVDDGSDLPLTYALADLASDRRLRVIRNDASIGVAAARNRGIEEAAGEWVGFCDDDDLWSVTKTRDQLRVDSVEKAVWTCSGAVAVDPALRLLYAMRPPTTDPEVFGEELLRRNVVPGGGSSVIARTSVVRALGGFDPTLAAVADWDMWIRLGEAGPLASVDRPLMAYVIHPQGMSNDVAHLKDDMARLRAKHRMRYHSAGIDADEYMWLSYLGYRSLRSGNRVRASLEFLRAAATSRKASSLAAATMTLISPDWMLDRRAAIVRNEIPRSWWTEAQDWLSDTEDLGSPADDLDDLVDLAAGSSALRLPR